MRINNKYLRNRAYRAKHWNRIRAKEQPFKTYMPWSTYNSEYIAYGNSTEEQIENHFEWITEQARRIENGSHRHGNHAPKYFRKILNGSRKAWERRIMAKIRQGDYEAEMPTFKRDADWLYF